MEENLEQSDWMKGTKGTGFTTPSNYFEALTEEINGKIAAERIRAIAAADGYTVPDGYFEQMKANILAKTTDRAASKATPKIVRLWQSGILKYASAACFVIIAGTGLYFNMSHQNATRRTAYSDMATEQMLFDIDEDVIIEHIEAKDERAPGASQAALENYILNNYSQNDLAGNL